MRKFLLTIALKKARNRVEKRFNQYNNNKGVVILWR